MKTTGNEDLYQTITDKLIALMEQGERPWVSRIDPYGNFHNGGLPMNGATGKPYKGVNIGILLTTAWVNGYDLPFWMTYRQAAGLGAQVRKGEKGTKVVHFDWVPKKDAKGNVILRSNGEPEMYAKTTTGTVFNARQIDNLPEHLTNPVKAPTLPDEGAETFFANVGATIYHRNEKTTPHYKVKADTIYMPHRHFFVTSAAYYATLAHELAHWTMAPNRLNRQFTRDWIEALIGQKVTDAEDAVAMSYYAEELVAEMASAFVCAQLGIEPEPRPDSADYLLGYAKLLKLDPHMVAKVFSLASEAASFIVEKGKGTVTAMVPVDGPREVVVAGKRRSKTPHSVASERAKKAWATRRAKEAQTHAYEAA